MIKLVLLIGIFFCGLSVVMGAFGAHALKGKLSEYSMSVYNKAVLYQMFHSSAIIMVVLLTKLVNHHQLYISAWLFTIGIVIFSGSLYLLSITGIKWLGAITPIGGILLIIGWIVMFYVVISLKI